MMTKEEATRLGKDMLKKLGKGWKLRVHENIGWHCSCTNGPLYVSVHQYGDGDVTYSSLMTSDPVNYPNCGEPLWHNQKHKLYRDVVECVQDQVQYAREVTTELVSRLLTQVDAAEKAINIPAPVITDKYGQECALSEDVTVTIPKNMVEWFTTLWSNPDYRQTKQKHLTKGDIINKVKEDVILAVQSHINDIERAQDE